MLIAVPIVNVGVTLAVPELLALKDEDRGRGGRAGGLLLLLIVEELDKTKERGAAELLLLGTIEDCANEDVVIVKLVIDVEVVYNGLLVGDGSDEDGGRGTEGAEEVGLALKVGIGRGMVVVELEMAYTVVMTDCELRGQLATLGGQLKTVM